MKFRGFNMRIGIFHASKYGNGEKAAGHLKGLLCAKGHDVKVSNLRKGRPGKIAPADLLVFISPIYIGRPSGKMRRFIRKLDPGLKNTGYCLVVTGAEPEKSRAGEKLRSLIDGRGLKMAADPIELKVEGIKGPLKGPWKEKLEAMVKSMA